MSHQTLAYLCAALALGGLIAYVLLGGADFGGGVWDFLASGPRREQQREAIENALAPVWEANHVWLIFVIVLLFTCFPGGYAALCTGLFIPMHVVLLGIVLRGAAFVFRKYGAMTGGETRAMRLWDLTFGGASVISPLLLGMSFGAITSGAVRAEASTTSNLPWISPYSLGCGFLALSTCAYLAAVYLVVETDGEVREDFRKRAVATGTTTAALAALVLLLAYREAHWFVEQLFSLRSLPIVVVGIGCFAASALAVFRRHYLLSCVCAIAEVIALLIGWGVAHREFIVYPDFPLVTSAAPSAMLRFVLISTLFGLLLLVPSLVFLMRVFKGHLFFSAGNQRTPAPSRGH